MNVLTISHIAGDLDDMYSSPCDKLMHQPMKDVGRSVNMNMITHPRGFLFSGLLIIRTRMSMHKAALFFQCNLLARSAVRRRFI
jgi:hypothetical protein